MTKEENEIEIQITKEKQVKSFEGFRVWEVNENGSVKEIMSGTKDEIDKLDKLDGKDWTKTYAIRIGKLGLK